MVFIELLVIYKIKNKDEINLELDAINVSLRDARADKNDRYDHVT